MPDFNEILEAVKAVLAKYFDAIWNNLMLVIKGAYDAEAKEAEEE